MKCILSIWILITTVNLAHSQWSTTGVLSTPTLTTGGKVGIGIVTPNGLLHLRDGGFWSSYNYGPNLVIDGPHHNAIGIFDAGNSNPIAIANVSGVLTIAKMPPLGNTSTNPIELLTVNSTNGSVGIGTTAPRAPLEVRVTGNNSVVQTGLIIQQTNTGSPNNAAGISLDFGIGNNYNNNNIEGRITVKETYWATRPKMFFSLWDINNTMQDRMVIDTYGNVGIGTTNPTQKLNVNGTVYSKEVKVDLNVPGPDYVFADNYQLPTLNELKTYIDLNKHLPEVPSAAAMEANGINLGEMNMLLLRKIEELTLYIIDQRKELDELKQRSVSPDPSGKKVEELTLYVIEQNRKMEKLEEKVNTLETIR